MQSNIPFRRNGSPVLIDGPNIDGVLGQIVRSKPNGSVRPRWDHVCHTLAVRLGCARAEFVMNGTIPLTEGSLAFCRFLHSNRIEVARPVRSTVDQSDPVDAYIIDQIAATKAGNLVLLSHDHGYAAALSHALSRGIAVTVVGFKEWLSPALVRLAGHGANILDLETDLNGFRQRLHRTFRVA